MTERYTDVERSQHLTQADPKIFGQKYVANCSSVDGPGAFLQIPADHCGIDYFQSLEPFHEDGLPTELPAALKDALKGDPELMELQNKVSSLQNQQVARPELVEAKNRLAHYR